MSRAIKFTGINFLDNPSPFTSPIKVEFWYECVEPLVEHIQWKLFYLQKDESDDLLLEEVWDGPVNLGPHHFLLEADAPDPSLLQKRYIFGVQAIKLSAYMRARSFCKSVV